MAMDEKAIIGRMRISKNLARKMNRKVLSRCNKTNHYLSSQLIEHEKLKITTYTCIANETRCCTLRRAKNTPTRSFVSNLYISQHSLPENGSQT